MEQSSWPVDGGEVGALIRAHDWSRTPLGPIDTWPQCLKTSVDLILAAPLPMAVLWGPELIQIYNDACPPLMGDKHPGGLGQPTRECWPEVWNFEAPIYEAVFRGESRVFADQLLNFERHGGPEDVWFDLTYSPLRDQTGAVAGVLVTILEATARVRAKRQLVAERDRLRDLFRQAPGFMAILRGPDHVYELVNDAYYQLVGHRDLTGKPMREALPELVDQGFFTLFDQVFQTGEPFLGHSVPIRFQRHPDGPPQERFVTFIFQPVRDADGRVTGIFVEGQDVTEATRAEMALREQEERFRALVNASSDVVYRMSADWTEMHQLDGRGFISDTASPRRNWLEEYIPPDEQPRVLEAIREAVRTRSTFELEHRVRRVDGTVGWTVSRAIPLLDANGDVTEWFGAASDVTPRKQAEEALRASEQRLRLALGAGRLGEWELDIRTDTSVRALRHDQIFGYHEPVRNWGYETFISHVLPEDRDRVTAAFKAAIEQCTGWHFECRIRRADNGEIRWIAAHGEPQAGDDGRVVRFFGLVGDITEQRRAEEALRESEARFRAIAEQAEIGISLVDIEGRVSYVNDRWCDLVGRSRDKLIGRTVQDLTHPEDWVANEPPFRRVLSEGTPFMIEKRYLHPDGSSVWVRNAVSALRDAEGRIVGCFAMSLDISDRKAAEEALRESEARFRDVANSAPVMIWLADSTAACTYMNRRWYEFTGQSDAEPLGSGWLSAIHPTDRAQVERAWGKVWSERKPFRFEFRLRGADGTYRWVLGDGVPRLDSDGVLLGYAGSVTDIDERREAEQRQALLAREVDHRARNALAVVQAMVRLTRAERPEEFRTAVTGRVAALARAHGLLAKSRWAGTDLRTLISEELAPYLDPADPRATLDGLPVVLAPDAVQPMSMVLHELVTNAVKYGALSTPKGRIEVRWEPDQEGLRLDWREEGGPLLPGAPARHGFGSRMIQSAADQLGGKATPIWARTGLRYIVTIGAKSLTSKGRLTRSGPDTRVPDAAPARLEGLHVLVVEDDALLAVEMQQKLEELGCVVVGPAGSLGEALRLAADAPKLDAAVLDVNLQGREIWPAAEILATRGVPRLFTTGYGDVVEGQDAPVLQKPVVMEHLASALASVLAPAKV